MNNVNPFEYLTEPEKHANELSSELSITEHQESAGGLSAVFITARFVPMAFIAQSM